MRVAVIAFLISAILFTAIAKAAATCIQECSNKGYSSGICRSWVISPTAKMGCEASETNIGETSDCYVQPGFGGIGRACCCSSGGTTITTTIPTTSTVPSTTISSDEKITTTTSTVPSATTTISPQSVTIDNIMGVSGEENPIRILGKDYNLKNVGGNIVRLSFDWTYIQNNGWSIKNGELRGNGTFDNYIIANTGDLADYTIEAKVKAMDSNLGDMSLIAGYQDVNNFYLISAKDSSLAIHKKVDGTYQQFKTSWSIPTIIQGVWHNLTISHTGYTLRVWWDGTHVGDWTDNDKNIKWSSGKVGARQDWYRSVSFDYVKINGQLYDDFATDFNADKWFFPIYYYSWSDDKVNDAFNNGLEVIGILGGKPNWLDMNMSIPNGVDSSDEKFFAEFVETTVTRYRDKVKFWEIYNEQNDKIPENYAKLLKVGYLKIKEIDPTLKVSVAGTSGTCVEWIEKVFEYFENRGEPHHYADMIGIHPYSFGLLGPDDIQKNISEWHLCSHGTLLDNMARAKQLIEKHSKNEELWITEIGWSTHSHMFTVVSEENQSIYIVQTLAEALSTQYLRKVMWAKFRDEEGWWDPFDHMGMLDDEGNPKKSYFAVKNMYEKLKSLPYKKSASTEAGVHAYVFGNEAKDVVVAWSSTPKSIPIYINSDFCDKFDLYGNFSGRLYAANGKVDLTVDKTPVYLECRMENVTTTSTTTSSTSTTTSSTTTTTIDNTKKCIDAGGECKTSCATENIVHAIIDFIQNLISQLISLFVSQPSLTRESTLQEIGSYPEYCTQQLPKCCKAMTCSDGTAYSQCSATKPKYCDNGNLVDKCSVCGCPSGYNCQSDGECIQFRFLTVNGSNFYLNGKDFLMYGVTLLDISPKNRIDFNSDRSWGLYDPQTVEKDFTEMESLGINIVRTWLPNDEFEYDEDKFNLTICNNINDFITRAGNHKIKAILAFSPGQTYNWIKEKWGPQRRIYPVWGEEYFNDEFRALLIKRITNLIIKCNFANNPDIAAYSIRQEPFFGDYNHRNVGRALNIYPYSPEKTWNDWVISKYGSYDNATKIWNFQSRKNCGYAKNLICPPNDTELCTDDPWINMSIDYWNFVNYLANKTHTEIISEIRKVDSNHLITQSLNGALTSYEFGEGGIVSNCKNAVLDPRITSKNFDFTSIDLYAIPKNVCELPSEDIFKRVEYDIAYAYIGKPIVLTEFGYPTCIFSNGTNTDSVQKGAYEKTMLAAMKNIKVNGLIGWLWRSCYEKGDIHQYGIKRVDDSNRPVYDLISPYKQIFENAEKKEPTHTMLINRNAHANPYASLTDRKDKFMQLRNDGYIVGILTCDEITKEQCSRIEECKSICPTITTTTTSSTTSTTSTTTTTSTTITSSTTTTSTTSSTTTTTIPPQPKFTSTKFNTTNTTSGHNITLSFNNDLNENATVLFIVTNEQGLVVDYFNKTVSMGMGSLSKLVNCTSLGVGNYTISWEAYLESDNKLLNAKAWSKPDEWKKVKCS